MNASRARSLVGLGFLAYALAAAARLLLLTITTDPRPLPGNEETVVRGITGLLHPADADAAFAVARAPLSAIALWPVSQALDASMFSTVLRAISCACFLAAVALVAVTVKAVSDDWLAAGLAAVILASARDLHSNLDRSPFAAIALALAALVMWLSARTGRTERGYASVVLAGVALALAQPLLAPLATIALLLLAIGQHRPRWLSVVPVVVALTVLVLGSLLGLDPLGRGGMPRGGSLWNLQSITGSLQGEIREAVELAWGTRALAAIVFVGLFSIGVCALRPECERRARLIGGGICLITASYLVTVVPAYVIVAHARAGDMPLTMFVGVQLGLACVAGIAIAGVSRSALGSALIGLATVAMLTVPLFDVRSLG